MIILFLTMNNPPLLRFATMQDAPGLSKAVKRLIDDIPYYNDLAKNHETERYNAHALSEKIKEDPYSVIIAHTENEIAGFCFSRFDDYTIWLEWFGVVKEFRGARITKQLLQKLEETVIERKCHKIWCDCRTSNQSAIHLLTATGYSQIATIKNHWYNQDFIIWERQVAS
ncbi:MAG: GNAT family N-acetyltransferase [Bacteroidota bacterium]